MKAYPIPLQNPLEAVQLEGIGAVTAEKLAKKWQSHFRTQDQQIQQPNSPGNSANPSINEEGLFEETSERATSQISTTGSQNPKQNKKQTTKTKGTTSKKMYIPKYQSGAFALLIGLYKSAIIYGRDYYISKTELAAFSQPYCGTPLLSSSQSSAVGKSRYSSWTGIKSLESKEYALRQGSSAKYCIGDLGIEPAQKIVAVLLSTHKKHFPDDNTSSLLQDHQSGDDENSDEIAIPREDIALFQRGSLLFNAASNLSNSELGSGLNSEIIEIDNINDNPTKISGTHIYDPRYPSIGAAPDSFDMNTISQEIDRTDPVTPDNASETSSNYYDYEYEHDNAFLNGSINDQIYTGFSDEININLNHEIRDNSEVLGALSSDRDINAKINDYIGQCILNPAFYEPDSYEIVLLVDIREVSSFSERDAIVSGLSEKGIKVEAVPIPIGDYVWVARPKPKAAPLFSSLSQGQSSAHISGNIFSRSQSGNNNALFPNSGLQNPEETDTSDILLNTVIERKRMSDLCSSIRDGRITEQKYRLQTCGIDKVIYVIEGEDPDGVSRLGEAFVYSTILRLTAFHDIIVKKLASTEDTINYLIMLTKLFTKKAKTEYLYVLPDENSSRFLIQQSKSRLLDMYPDREYCLKFDTFFKISGKSNNLSVAEVFARNLLTIRGISEEKAIELVKQFPTPKKLYTFLDQAPTFEAKVNLLLSLSESEYSISRKKINRPLAERIAQMWTSKAYES
ncbi:hypothetical protein BB560_003095 [Smittium megazygosporum]|uniref:Crossover junction endonuclease MUS81 n=1 Tax=Smittium megazygosporum TaxID=133381 RepID=A0A2T9ZCX9_9FUNG|nr:hypothetical protein BB560_003095 [Smittium megazygosporum]